MSHVAILLSAQNTVPDQTYPPQPQQTNEKSFRESLLLALRLSVSDLSQHNAVDITLTHNVNPEKREKDLSDHTHYGINLTGLLTPTQVAPPNSLEPEAWNRLEPKVRLDSGEDAFAKVEIGSGRYLNEDGDAGVDTGMDRGTETGAFNSESAYASSSNTVASLNTAIIHDGVLRESAISEPINDIGSSERNHKSSASMAAIDTVSREKHTHADPHILNDDLQVHRVLDSSIGDLASRHTFDVHIEREVVAKTGVANIANLTAEATRRVRADVQANTKSHIATNATSELEATRVQVSDSISESLRVIQPSNDRKNNSVFMPFQSPASTPPAVPFATDLRNDPLSASGFTKDIGLLDSHTDDFYGSVKGENNDDGNSSSAQGGALRSDLAQSLRIPLFGGFSEANDTGVNEGIFSTWKDMPDELYLSSGSSLGPDSSGQTGNTNLPSSLLESTKVDISSRIERVVEMQEVARHRSMSEMTLKLENYNGESDSIRVSLKGSHLETTIAVSESVRANEILSRLPELKRSLSMHGFDNHEVSVVSEEDSKREKGSHFKDHRKQSNQDEHK